MIVVYKRCGNEEKIMKKLVIIPAFNEEGNLDRKSVV